jgi:hypothetical protein
VSPPIGRRDLQVRRSSRHRLEDVVHACCVCDEVRDFVESTAWTFSKTYAATWPHEYVVRTSANAPMIPALARHIVEHGADGRFYTQVRKYHHEGGKVYWFMNSTPEAATLVNRCDTAQTFEVRRAVGTLPKEQQMRTRGV